MPLVTTIEMLKDAQQKHYAVGAFNIENMEMAQAVIAAAEAQRAPVIIQTTPGTLKYAKPATYAAIVASLAKEATVPVAMHLDHGDSYELAVECLNAGYSSVMIDGSRLSFEDNIAQAARVVAEAKKLGVPVEAELGKVGGKEDTLEDAGDEYTDPAKAAEYAQRTGISSLAVAIGTAHGVYKSAPKLDLERLRAIRKVTDIGLVLHGGSGLSDDDFRNVVRDGIQKVNVYTDISFAGTQAAHDMVKAGDKMIEHVSVAMREAIERATMQKLKLFGCEGKA